MFTRRILWCYLALFLFGAAAVQAHDVLQSSTNIWFQPDRMEVELIMSRVPTRALLDHPPPVPLTEADFESTYHELFQKCAPGLLELTVDGKKMAPGSIAVELYQDTDIRFDYIFPRPNPGRLHFTASFIKRMDLNYINTLSVNEGNSVLGFGNQDADKMDFEMNLGSGQDTPAPVLPPATAPAQSLPGNSSRVPMVIFFSGLFSLIFAGVALRWRRRKRESQVNP